jgi:ABC-type uncharacterized transport system substrate-binding protein
MSAERSFSWPKAAAIALLLAAVFYAAQHPHSFFACFLKVLIAPVP